MNAILRPFYYQLSHLFGSTGDIWLPFDIRHVIMSIYRNIHEERIKMVDFMMGDIEMFRTHYRFPVLEFVQDIRHGIRDKPRGDILMFSEMYINYETVRDYFTSVECREVMESDKWVIDKRKLGKSQGLSAEAYFTWNWVVRRTIKKHDSAVGLCSLIRFWIRETKKIIYQRTGTAINELFAD